MYIKEFIAYDSKRCDKNVKIFLIKWDYLIKINTLYLKLLSYERYICNYRNWKVRIVEHL